MGTKNREQELSRRRITRGGNYADTRGGDTGLLSLPLGGAAMIDYGKNNTLLLALMYEAKENPRVSPVVDADGNALESDGITERLTFVGTW